MLIEFTFDVHSFKKQILFLILLIKSNTSISYNNVYPKQKMHHSHTQCPAVKPLCMRELLLAKIQQLGMDPKHLACIVRGRVEQQPRGGYSGRTLDKIQPKPYKLTIVGQKCRSFLM